MSLPALQNETSIEDGDFTAIVGYDPTERNWIAFIVNTRKHQVETIGRLATEEQAQEWAEHALSTEAWETGTELPDLGDTLYRLN